MAETADNVSDFEKLGECKMRMSTAQLPRPQNTHSEFRTQDFSMTKKKIDD